MDGCGVTRGMGGEKREVRGRWEVEDCIRKAEDKKRKAEWRRKEGACWVAKTTTFVYQDNNNMRRLGGEVERERPDGAAVKSEQAWAWAWTSALTGVDRTGQDRTGQRLDPRKAGPDNKGRHQPTPPIWLPCACP